MVYRNHRKTTAFLGENVFFGFYFVPSIEWPSESKFALVFSSILATNVASNGQETEFYAEDTFDTEAHEPLEVEVTLGQKRWLGRRGPSSRFVVRGPWKTPRIFGVSFFPQETPIENFWSTNMEGNDE